ncbi:hypothetical protein [Pseudooceanicola sp.]|uniref:hypothetical protein n=1 Tax=Pseudooceanicola sp. TaxID=1914328 RepID=UPI0035131F43
MAGVAHTPHLEKRPSGYFFRRRLPKAWVEISNPGQSSAICLSLRTDVLSEATCRVRALTALTDLAVALTTERPVDHLSPEHVTLLTELARCQIAAHEALRASAEPRSEAAANFAAQAERATQDMLRRALALGDRSPVTAPLREMARRLGVTLDESTADWRALAFEALRVMLDVSREREKREVGTYEEVTPIFRSVMASRWASATVSLPVAASRSSAPALAVPAAAAPGAVAQPAQTIPAATTPKSATEAIAPLQAPVETAAAPAANADTVPASPATPQPAAEDTSPVVVAKDDETAFRIRMRPPLLKNIDLRDLSPGMQEILRTKPRGITLLEGIQLMKELKMAGYGEDFSKKQMADAEAGRRWIKDSTSKVRFAEKYWVEFVGDVAFECAEEEGIRDAMKLLPRLPNKHSKGKDKLLAKKGFAVLVDETDAEEERAEKDNLKALQGREGVTEADREKASLDARIPRLRSETRAKHHRFMNSVGRMLYDLQLVDTNPFAICAVSNADKKRWQKTEEKRKRTYWDDRIYTFLRSTAFQGPFEDPGAPLYWIPLIARLMGLREEEACQLGPDDFGSVRGIHYLDVKCIDGNRVKTEESQRRIPVHPILIDLGILRLAELRRKQGQHRLFPDLTRGKTKGRYSENFSKKFTYYRQRNHCYWEGLDLHAMRTSFNSDLMNQDKSDAFRCILMGHEAPDTGARNYDQGVEMQKLLERICDVELDVSMIARPFDGTGGLQREEKVVDFRSAAR